MGYCFKEFFQTWGGVETNASNVLVSRSAKGGGLFKVDIFAGKPFIPFAGVVTDASGVLKPDTIANHKTFIQAFVDFWTQCLQASENARDGIAGTVAYVSPYGQNNIDYSQYLVRKIGDPLDNSNANFNSYMAAMMQVWNFWNMSDAGWSNAQLNTALQRLVLELQESQQLRLFIPPGHYFFDSGNAFNTSWSNWLAASALLAGWQIVELDSIG